MPKRKEQHMSDDESGDSDNESIIQLDFDFFSPQPIDFQAFHRLLVQLFQSDSEPLQLRDLADLVIEQGYVGSTVKLDGEESDPLAMLSVVNMRVHAANSGVKAIREYISKKVAADPAFWKTLQSLLTREGHDIGMILSERLINMPVQIMPPMWRMLRQEVQAAAEQGQPFRFSHYLVISRTYRAPSDEDDPMDGESAPPSKKSKMIPKKKSAAAAAGASLTYPYHEEDTLISQASTHTLDYAFTNAFPREEGGFGLDMGGRVMLFEAARFQEVVDALEKEYPPPSAGGGE